MAQLEKHVGEAASSQSGEKSGATSTSVNKNTEVKPTPNGTVESKPVESQSVQKSGISQALLVASPPKPAPAPTPATPLQAPTSAPVPSPSPAPALAQSQPIQIPAPVKSPPATPTVVIPIRSPSSPNIALLKSPSSPGSGSPKLRKTPPFPMGSLHQAYWIGRKGSMEKKGVSCHFYFQFEGNWDIERLQKALNSVIVRHAALRTIVLPEGMFKILEYVPPYTIATSDFSGMADQEASAEIEAIKERMSHQSFDTNKWPLFEIRISSVSSTRQILHIDFDHIILDMKGGFHFMTEWGLFYENVDLVLPPIETTMYNYMLGLERYRLSSTSYQAALTYWKAKGASLPNSPSLPIVKELSTIDGPKFSRRLIHFSPEVWASISNVAKRIGVTPSILILTAYARVLSVWSNSTQFTITVVAFNRQDVCKDADKILGDFTSTILLSVDASDISLFDMAKKLQDKLHKDLENVQVSGVEVIREMSKDKGRSEIRTFPVVFTSVLDRDSSIDWLGDFQAALSETPQVYMDCIAFMFHGGLHLSLDFVEEVFPSEFVPVMFSAFGRLLGVLHEENGFEIWSKSSHTTLIPASQRLLRTQINATKSDFPNVTLHHLFLEQVALNPTAQALVDAYRNTWTYQELFEHAWLTKTRLQQSGVKKDIVAVVAKKGWEQIVSVLAVLLSGAAYLPVDITFPSDRVDELLMLGKVKHCLVPSKFANEFSTNHPRNSITPVVTIDEYHNAPKSYPSPTEIPSDDPSHLAYVLFTSGSTGVPKGVMVEHVGAVNTISFVLQRFSVQSDDTVLFLNALHFDLSVFDIFGTLAAGARLVIPLAEQVRDPVVIARLILNYNVTVWNSVPQMLNLLLEHLNQIKSTVAIRLVMLSGDVVRSNIQPNFSQEYSIL